MRSLTKLEIRFGLSTSMFLAGYILASYLFMCVCYPHVASPAEIVMPDDPTTDEYERCLCLQLDRRDLLIQRKAYLRDLKAFHNHLKGRPWTAK